jgi:hypothetical protein
MSRACRIGLFLDAGTVDGDIGEYLKHRFKLAEIPNLHGSLFRVPPDDDEGEEFIVVRLPESKLDCVTIENIIKTKNEQERSIDRLKNEIDNLNERVAHSVELRQEALRTVNKLRGEFIGLMQDITPREVEQAPPISLKSRQSTNSTTSPSAREQFKHGQSIPRLRMHSHSK